MDILNIKPSSKITYGILFKLQQTSKYNYHLYYEVVSKRWHNLFRLQIHNPSGRIIQHYLCRGYFNTGSFTTFTASFVISTSFTITDAGCIIEKERL